MDNETKVDDSVALSSCTNVGGGIGHKDYVQRKHAEVEMVRNINVGRERERDISFPVHLDHGLP